MGCGYISSNDNRLYVGLELVYGEVAAITSASRFPAVKLDARQELERRQRKDKTGSRTYPGTPGGLRKRTTFDVTTYLTGWTRQDAEPSYGPLFQASLGKAPQFFTGGTAGANTNAKLLTFEAPHGLAAGQAVTFGGELRFVISIVDPMTVELNAPFSLIPSAGSPIGPTVTYAPATDLPTVSIYDYWDPAGSVQRILNGSAVDKMRIKVNADFHEFEFSGLAKDLLDNVSFSSGQGALQSFPDEPALEQFDYSIVPGHIGQAWLDNTPDRFYTITAASLTIDNGLEARAKEFGAEGPRCIAPGPRSVSADFELYEMNDAQTKGLYQAARQYSPVGVMFQLGQQAGQLFGAYLKSVVPEVPEFDDGDNRLQWTFKACRAQGTVDDEIVVAFG